MHYHVSPSCIIQTTASRIQLTDVDVCTLQSNLIEIKWSGEHAGRNQICGDGNGREGRVCKKYVPKSKPDSNTRGGINTRVETRYFSISLQVVGVIWDKRLTW